jgi:hypothetical protein
MQAIAESPREVPIGAIAAETGLSRMTVNRARSTVPHGTLEIAKRMHARFVVDHDRVEMKMATTDAT